MKKVVLFFVAGAALCLASCCGSKCDKAACEAAKADSIRIADSIAKADSAAAAVAALATQDLLKDFIAGISIILESQYRIGDIVTIDGFKGEVIFLSLKTTKIESYTGEVKIIANHNINNVVNHSITDSLAIVDVSVAYDSDLEKVEKVLIDLSKDLSTKIPELKGDIEVLGVQELADSAVVYRLTALTEAMQQLGVQRQILKAVKVAFDKNGIEIPFPQVVVHNG